MEGIELNVKDQNRDYIFVLFIENHLATIPFTLKLSKKNNEASDLLRVYNNIFEVKNKQFIYSIYSFKLNKSKLEGIKDKKNYEIDIKGKTSALDKYRTKIAVNITNIKYDKYIFNFKFDSIKSILGGNKEPPESYPFDLIKQLEIFVNYVRKILKLKSKDKENDSLILSAHELFIGKGKDFEFSFYISIFMECFSSPTVQRHLEVFRLDKIKGEGKLDEKKKKQILGVLNVFQKNPNKALEKIKENKDKYGVKLFAIIIYFNYLYFNESLKEIINNKQNEAYILQALRDYQKLFKNFKLDRDKITLLIKISENFKQIKNSLSYADNLYDLLILITDNFNRLKGLYDIMKNECKNEENEDDFIALIDEGKIDIDEIIIPNENDNMEKISELYKTLIILQNGDYFVLFVDNFFIKYINYFNEKNLDNLFYIKDIIKYSKEKIKEFDLKDINIDRIIHDTGLKLVLIGELKNIKLLKFIQNDEFYNSVIYKKKTYRSLSILNGLDIKGFDEAFYTKWKEINWNEIFNEQYVDFLDKISELIFDKKDFKILFKLFNKSKDDVSYDFHPHAIILLQNKFIELYKNYTPENDNDEFFEYIYVIILYSDKKYPSSLEKYLEKNLQASFKPKLVNKIYINYINNNNDDISQKTKDIIINFFTSENSTQETLLYLVSNCQHISNQILQNIKKYDIKEKDFFNVEDTENYKLFKGLLNSNNIIKNDFQNTNYIKNTKSILNKIQNNIKTGDIKFSDISKFYENKNKENKLLEIIQSIYLNNKEEAEKYKLEIDTHYLQINDIIENLQIILDDLLTFYRNEEKEKIIDLKQITDKIRSEKLKYYKNNLDFIDKYNYFKNNYLKKAKERISKRKSIFFTNIFQNYQETYKNDEKKITEETEKTFDKLKDIFIAGVHSLNKNILQICLNSIKERSRKEIFDDLEILENIFQIKDYNKEIIVKSMILLSKKKYLYNILIGISIFLEKLGVQGNFLELLKNHIKNLDKSNDENIISKAADDLKSFSIDILDDKKSSENSYLNIILKLKEQPDSILFLLGRKIEDCRSMQELVGEIDNALLNTNDILDLEKCVEFMNKLGDDNTIKNKKDIDLIKSFKNEVEKNKEIEIYFKRYVDNYSELKSLVDYGLDKSEASKKKILLLCTESEFILTNIKDKFFNANYYEIIEEKGKKNKVKMPIKIENLFELRDRAQLSKKLTGDEKELQILENNKRFIEKFMEINKIYGLLKEIYKIGYPEKIEIQININNFISVFNGLGINTKDYKEIINKLNDILFDLEEALKIAYEKKPLIRFIYGRLFNLMYDIMKENKENEKDKISPFLKFLSNNLIKKEIQKFSYKSKGNIYEDIIENSERYINETLKNNKLDLQIIFNDTKIVEKIEGKNYKGIFIHKCEELEKNLFQIYKYLTKHTPVAQTILLCNKETSKEQLTAFLHRAILCDFNSCFIIGGVELLQFEQKSILLELINNLFVKDHQKMKSCLIILLTSSNTDIFKSLNLIKEIKNLKNLPNKVSQYKVDNSKAQIISSDKSGVGKSTQIKLEIENQKKNYIYFPFGGDFERKDVIKRLKKLKIPDNSIIHLDLYDTDQTELMTDFLFSMLITKLYGQNEDIFYLSKDIEIKIEIPNGFIDFMKKFPILSLFSSKEPLSIKKLAPLIVPQNIDSNIQIVANFLKSLKDDTIDSYDLYFEGISPEIFLSDEYKETTMVALPLSQKECEELIFTTIKKDYKEPNYYQIRSFIDILATQFIKFNKNYHLSASVLNEFNIDEGERTFLINSFIEITKYFTKGAYDSILNSQQAVHKLRFGEYNEKEYIDIAMEVLADSKHEIVSFKSINPFLLFFHEGDGQGFSFITNKLEHDEEYDKLINLKNYQIERNIEWNKTANPGLEIKGERYKVPNYLEYKPEQFLSELKDILDVKNPVNEEEQKIIEKQRLKEKEKGKEDKNQIKLETLKKIAGSYVFTADNFVKMALILLRIRANIPVIMMGETGCGKTSLIRKLSQLINNGSTDKMKIKNIHAGVNDQDIIDFLEKDVLNEAKDLEVIEEKNKAEAKKKGMDYYPKKIWVFFDEINTCKSMGLISEIMCKHTYQGNPLPKNIVFIAACNPYRQGNKNIMGNAGLDIKHANKELSKLNEKEKEKLERLKNNSLVYTVNPLPHSLLNFVFYFGSVLDDDEKKYIESIISEAIYEIYNKRKENITEDEIKKVHIYAKDMIVCAQNYIRKNNDVSSVSLREIRRFNIFYEFFFNYLNKKKDIKYDQLENKIFEGEDKFYQKLNDFSLYVYSVNLSIFVCYYLRLTDINSRNELRIKLNEIFNNLDESFKGKDFLEVPQKEELYVVNNIELEKGIAKNRALLDNIFSLFVTINNKIPIFIVGKPGCSKSLSVQLINKAMKGSSSKALLFKRLPKIILNSYQGSMDSTSEGVLKVFKLSRDRYKRLKEEDKKNNISLIFFDEMGLAEHSPNNPLKVIHSQLEYDLNEGDNKIAFVGISNWSLDASKMNRGMFLSIPEPTENDTKQTALTIGQSYDNHLAEVYNKFYEYFGEIYFTYKDYLKTNHNSDGKDEFHGNRDFYHSVKIGANKLLETDIKQIDKNKLQSITIESIERNFGGLQFEDLQKTTSLELVKTIISNKIKEYKNISIRKDYDVLERIKQNIQDVKSRYLMVISKSSISTFLLSSILSSLNKEFNFYIGSKFQDDLQSEEYSLKILNKIQLHMEQGKILILKNLESVYPHLYDLFNQNFQEMGKKKYARIAIGSSTNTFSLVDPNFRCIVSVDEDQVKKEEPPFLNRFEKHIVSIEYLLKTELINESKKIKNTLSELISYDKNIYKGLNYDLAKIFINFHDQEIQSIIYQSIKNGIKSQELMNEVIKNFSLILPQDILLCMKLNGFQNNNQEDSKQIIEYYNKGEHRNLRRFIEKMESTKNVVYTFSNILDVINKIDDIDNKMLGNINKDNISILQMASFKSENEFEKQIDNFFGMDKYKLCLIKFTSSEGNFLNYIKFFIENKEKNFITNKKGEIPKKAFIFIVHIHRIFDSELQDIEQKSKEEQDEINKKELKETISFQSGYYQIFIDNLNGDDGLILDNLINLKGGELFKKLIDFDNILMENIYKTFEYMKYNIPSSIGKLNQDTYINKLIKYIENNKELRDNINKCILKHMEKEENIIFKVFKLKNSVGKNDLDILYVIRRNLYELYVKHLNLLYFKAEQDQFFSSLLSIDEPRQILEEEKKKKLKNAIVDEDDKQENNNKNNEENLKEEEMEKNIIVKSMIKRAIEIYLENLIYMKDENEQNIIEEPGMNNLDIILGLELPGIKPIINIVANKFKNAKLTNYQKNESLLRRRDFEEEAEVDYAKEKYLKDLKKINESTFIEFEKNNVISKIIEKDEIKKTELFDLLIEDYYTLFIEKNLTKNILEINNIKKMLRIIIKITNEMKDLKEDDSMKNASRIINWLEYYYKEMIIILEMFYKLSKYISDLYEQIKDIIENNKVQPEESERYLSYMNLVNKPFFYGIESILRVLTTNDKLYINLKKDLKNFSQFINMIKELLQKTLKITISLNLFSKEIYSLEEILLLIDCFKNNNIDTDENISKLLNFFNNETILINSKKEDELIQNFQNFYKFLEKLIGKDKSFIEIMSTIFKNEYLKIYYKSFRNKLIEIILSKDEFIIKNNQIIKFIIDIGKNPDEMSNNLNELENDQLMEIFNKCQKESLEEAIINIFEYKILLYFEGIPKLDFKVKENQEYFPRYYKSNKEEEKKTFVIYDLSLNIFKDCLLKLDEIYQKKNDIKNDNICKLFSISYIKIYLSKLVYFLIFKKQEFKEADEIMKIIKGPNAESKLRKVIKIYIFKIYFNLLNRNWNNLIQYRFKSDSIDFHDILVDKNEEYLTINLLPSEIKEYNSLNEINKKLNECKSKKFDNVNKELLDLVNKYGIDLFLISSINNIVSNFEGKNYLKDEDYLKYTNSYESIINKYKCSDNLKSLFSLFFNHKKYNEIVKPKINDFIKDNNILEYDPFECLLYGYRFCIQSSEKEKTFLYSSLLTNECSNSLKISFIPGNYNIENKNEIKIGYKVISKEIFSLVHKKVRNLSEIGFRLLNFILFSHFFFSICLNNGNEELQKIHSEMGINILEIIIINWNMLDKALRKKNIALIQVFINLIFKKLSELIKNCNIIKKESDLNKFEEKVESLIDKCIKEYSDYSKKYLEENEKQTKMNKDSIRVIITELLPPLEENYPYKDYPFLKYFIYTKYRTIDDLYKELGPEEKYKDEYPLLYKYLTENKNDSDVKKLIYLPKFNRFVNFMIDFYSFNIQREEAKKTPLNQQENLFQENGFNNLFEGFIKAWNAIYEKSKKYKNNEIENIKSLNIGDNLAYFLIDNNEPNYGMRLAAGYENFIKWQNGFLNHIIKAGVNNKYLSCYIEGMNKKIPIQDANPNQILRIDINEKYSGSYTENFSSLVNLLSRRNIFGKNGEINYLNYNSFLYDFPLIEEELAKIILSGKCMFENEDKLNFVTYWGEGFSGNKSEIMNKFYSKYKQRDLEEREKEIILTFIKTKRLSNKLYDFKPLFGSMQLLIFYLTNNNFKEDDLISEIISNKPNYLRINKDCITFFAEFAKDFKTDIIMNVFFLFEHLCFEGLCNTLEKEYKTPIDEEKKEKIKNKLINSKISDDISIKQFGAALRRFISRYLVGKKQKVSDVSTKSSLTYKLDRPDLWDEKIGKIPNLREILSELLKELNLTVDQSYEFYQLIKDKDEEEIYNLDVKDDQKEEGKKKKKKKLRI